MEMLYECAGCHLPLDRARIHYGGLSCYSCRAFFRRKTQKDDLTKCQLKQECKISYIERKSCPPCRYEKCLRAGMRSELVLNDNEKNRRFKKHVKTSDESDDEDLEIIEVVKKSGKRVMPDQQKDKKRKRETKAGIIRRDPLTYQGPKQAPSFQPNICSWKTFTSSDSESDYDIDYLWPVSMPEAVENEIEDENKEECFLDPETGIMVNTSDQQHVKDDNYNDMEVTKHSLSQTKEGQVNQCMKENDSFYPVYKYSGSSSSSICSPTSFEARKKNFVLTRENQILKYVHKKFGVATAKEHRPIMDGGHTSIIKKENGILNTSLNLHNDNHQHHSEHLHEHHHSQCQPRETVLVKQVPTGETNLIERMDQIYEETEGFSNDNEHFDIVSSLTIQEIENMYTMEEETYFKNTVNTFYKNWKAISFGPEIMGFFIDFCQKPRTLPVNYFTENNKVTRERLLNCICSTEDMELLSTNCQYSLLKRNIPFAELLVNIAGFNYTEDEDLIEWALGEGDLIQWKDRPKGLAFVPLETTMSYAPFPEAVKTSLDKTMKFSFKPILHDRHVFALLVMMVVFCQDQTEPDAEVASILTQYWTMLRRHLKSTMCEDLEEILLYLHNCFDTLPTLLEDNYEALVEIL